MYWNLASVSVAEVCGMGDLPCKAKVIRQVARMHLLLDAFSNSMPVPGSAEVLIVGVKSQLCFASTSKLEQ